MKSIIEEASSVAKAIEKGWIRAGKPQEFTIKVFEDSQKNFIGMTTKSAKVGIFFNDYAVAQHHAQPARSQQRDHAQPRKNQQAAHQPKPTQPAPRMQQPKEQSHVAPQPIAAPRQERPAKKEYPTDTPWNAELLDAAQNWLHDALVTMRLENVTFTKQIDRYALKITFESSLQLTPERQKDLFRAWAYLLMQSLRYKFKRPLKGLKVILTSNA